MVTEETRPSDNKNIMVTEESKSDHQSTTRVLSVTRIGNKSDHQTTRIL